MQAEKRSDESQYARIVQLVREAQHHKPAIQRLADRYAVWFTPLTLVMCAAGWLITGDARTIVAVLVVATPCPLILATPIAIISGINRAARAGIIVKSGAAIEQVSRAHSIVFDKTGTLTDGTPVVERIVPANGVPADDLLYLAASVEQLSSHLLGQTLARAAQEQWTILPLPSAFKEVPGHGVEGIIEDRHVVVGSPRFVEKLIGTGEADDRLSTLAARDKAKLAATIAVDRQLAGHAVFAEHLRPGVPALIERLSRLGVQETMLLTGDGSAHAHAIAEQAGITQVKANCLPQDKVAVIEELKHKREPVVMVGDGINDAPALATATVGIAMGAQGTGISSEAADIVLLVDDVTRVGDAVAIGRRTIQIARQSIFVGLGLSFLLMIIAAFGILPPPIGALSQELVDVAVILNALRAR
jgi:heavy metal translocating P-type ATPase